jgi:hypothetical protein
MPVIPALRRQKLGGSWVKASLSRKLTRLHLDKQARLMTHVTILSFVGFVARRIIV